MARKLPWLASASKKARHDDDGAPAKKLRRVTPAEEQSDHSQEASETAATLKDHPRTTRNGSSSPPPTPPEEVFMRDGADADDGWRLVEDELWSSAGMFTRHLHHAEYQRQKQLAKSRNEGTVQNITQPVNETTELSAERRKRMEGSRERDGGRNTFTSLGGNATPASDNEEDDPWLRDPRLAGLMTQKESTAPLAKIAGVQSTSRAAKGFLQGQPSPAKPRSYAHNLRVQSENSPTKGWDEGSAEYDSDDLDAPSYREPLSVLSKPLSKAYTAPESSRLKRDESEQRIQATKTSIGFNDDSDNTDMFDPFPMRQDRTRERKLDREVASLRMKKDKEEDKQKRPFKADEIPTFLV